MRPVNLEERCHQDVLEKVRKKQIRKVGHNEVSEDIHPGFHVLKPNGEPRLITDLTGLNRKLYRQVQPFTPATDLIKQLDPEANYNCKMDFLHGFHQLRLDEKSQKMNLTCCWIISTTSRLVNYHLTSCHQKSARKLMIAL